VRLANCHNFHDYRKLARRRLPGPIFNYIDGAADDEATHRRNTKAFEDVDLVPRVLRGVGDVDLSVTVLGQKLDVPFYCFEYRHDGASQGGRRQRHDADCR